MWGARALFGRSGALGDLVWWGGAWSELQTHCEGPWVPGFRGHLPGSEEETPAHTWVGLARPPPPLRE